MLDLTLGFPAGIPCWDSPIATVMQKTQRPAYAIGVVLPEWFIHFGWPILKNIT